jgi:hypothetical protein
MIESNEGEKRKNNTEKEKKINKRESNGNPAKRRKRPILAQIYRLEERDCLLAWRTSGFIMIQTYHHHLLWMIRDANR